MCSLVSVLGSSHSCTHYPTAIRWRSISTGCKNQIGKWSTVLLLSSTSLIYFCCDVIPFTFHFFQQESAYAIFIRNWALLHGLFLGTINQCISLHCRLTFLFASQRSMKCVVARERSFLWVPRHTLCFSCKTLGFSVMCIGLEDPVTTLSWILQFPDTSSCQKCMQNRSDSVYLLMLGTVWIC